MFLSFALNQIIDYNRVWCNRPAVMYNGALGENQIYSEEEIAKLKQAYDLIMEVRKNYRATYYELRSKVK